MAKEGTLEWVLRHRFPDVFERADREGVWDYRIISPLGFEDAAQVKVQVQFGKKRNEAQVELVLELDR